MAYKRLNDQLVLRLVDSAEIPEDPANADFRKMQEDLLAGENLLPADPPPALPPELVKLLADKEVAKQQARLQALADLSPSEVIAWVAKNVVTLADAKELLGALAVAVSILVRQL